MLCSNATPFATAIYAGLRKGELAGLEWDDVDFGRGLITIARSYDAGSTKTGKVRQVPISDELRAHLLVAEERRKGCLVFPMPDGTMMPDNIKLAPILERALKRAGVVLGRDYVCRRKGCGHLERRIENVEARCPKCNMRLWVKPIPKRIAFRTCGRRSRPTFTSGPATSSSSRRCWATAHPPSPRPSTRASATITPGMA